MPGPLQPPETYNPPTPLSEGRPLHADSQAAQPEQRLQEHDVSSRMTPPAMPDRQGRKAELESRSASTAITAEIRNDSDAPGGGEAPPSPQFSSDSPAVGSTPRPTDVSQSRPVEAPIINERGDLPHVEAQPASRVGQTERNPGIVTAHETVAGRPNESHPGASRTPSQSGQAEATAAHPSIAAETSNTGIADLPVDPAVEQGEPDHPPPQHQLHRQGAETEPTIVSPQHPPD